LNDSVFQRIWLPGFVLQSVVMIAFSALIGALSLATAIGLIDLIAKGYGTLTWIFILIFGAWKILYWKDFGSISGGAPA
jgi:uncharacterized membrane protein YkvI